MADSKGKSGRYVLNHPLESWPHKYISCQISGLSVDVSLNLSCLVFHRHPSGYECSPVAPGIIQAAQRTMAFIPEESRR